jgi:hypothetical protein
VTGVCFCMCLCLCVCVTAGQRCEAAARSPSGHVSHQEGNLRDGGGDGGGRGGGVG